MTPDQITLVQSTFTTVTADADLRLAKRFYEHLFRISPESRSLFSTDPAVQRQKFTDELGAIVWSIGHLDDFLATTMSLGARHVAYGATIDHYRLVGDALLAALADELGEACTDEVTAAWRAAYDLVAEAMMMGAAPVRNHR
jgi:nitric oxide dioxygenase